MNTSFFCKESVYTVATKKGETFGEVESYAQTIKKTCVTMQQVHGDQFIWLDNSKTAQTQRPLQGVDGVLTNCSEALLTVRTADCLPILLYHPSGIVGALHAGRKSTQLGLLHTALTFLKEEKKVTTNLHLWFGPAICKNCYQVDQETNTHYNLIKENTLQAHLVFSPNDTKLEVQGDCTQCLNTAYHSYRVEKENAKMNYFGISLLE